MLGDLRRRLTVGDTLLLVLLGHGTYDGIDAKFNLVGPDLSAAEWKDALEGLAGRLVVVNTTESSFPFLEQLSSRGRVVITATDSAAQRFATVFPEYFIRSLVDRSSDFDKNGRVSILEAFNAASAGVKQHYEQRGQLSTERPLIDDDGDRVGREAAGARDGRHGRAVAPSSTPIRAASAASTRDWPSGCASGSDRGAARRAEGTPSPAQRRCSIEDRDGAAADRAVPDRATDTPRS